MTSQLAAYAAGALSALSPCVFPVLPLIAGSALQRSRFAPLLMAGGQVAAFATVGSVLVAFGSIGQVSSSTFRVVAGAVMLVAGGGMLLPAAADRFSSWLAPAARWASAMTSRLEQLGAPGYVAAGALLGVVWSPCTGPVLGAVIGLAAVEGLGPTTILTMTVFALGATTPLLVAAYGARYFVASRGRLGPVGRHGKTMLGGALLAVGVLVVFGLDKMLEARVLEFLPDAWVRLTTRL